MSKVGRVTSNVPELFMASGGAMDGLKIWCRSVSGGSPDDVAADISGRAPFKMAFGKKKLEFSVCAPIMHKSFLRLSNTHNTPKQPPPPPSDLTPPAHRACGCTSGRWLLQ